MPDLAAALNRLMAARGLAPFTLAETAAMVGDGVAKLVERAFAARGVESDAAAVAAFSADYGAHVAVASRLYPGVAETLGGLAEEGWRLAVCTNKPEQATHALLAATGLAPLFAAVGGGDSFPVRKPDPAHLLATLRAAGGDAGGGGHGRRPPQRRARGARRRRAVRVRRLGLWRAGYGRGRRGGGTGFYRAGRDRAAAAGGAVNLTHDVAEVEARSARRDGARCWCSGLTLRAQPVTVIARSAATKQSPARYATL